MTIDLRLGSLRAKLVALVGALLVAITVFILLFFPARMEQVAVTGVERRATGMAAVLSAAVAPGLEFDDAANVKGLLDQLKVADGVLYAAVRRSDGTLFAAFHEDLVPPAAASPGGDATITQVGARLELVTPVRARAGASGSLMIGFSLADLEREKQKNRAATLIVAAVVLGVGLLVTFVFGTYFVRPIRRMTEIALQIARGDLSQPEIDHRGRDEVGRMAEAFDRMLRALRGLAGAADDVAAGDLSGRLEIEGQVAEAFNRMIEAQRVVVKEIADTSSLIARAAVEMYAASQAQEAAAQQQSSGVAAVSRTMGSLLGGAADISESAKGVLANAERTRQTTDLTAQKLAELSGHTSRIGEILEVIRDIADRSDLLALNASIEGSRAGEAGRTFSLVAAEMRRLAERVTASVEDIQALVSDVQASGSATASATEEGRRLAESTTDSARAITSVTQQQRTGTEDVSRSMAEIEGLLAQSVSTTRRTRALAEDLKARAAELAEVVGSFRVSSG
jgi:methyl-accepting chemotaxis protein